MVAAPASAVDEVADSTVLAAAGSFQETLSEQPAIRLLLDRVPPALGW